MFDFVVVIYCFRSTTHFGRDANYDGVITTFGTGLTRGGAVAGFADSSYRRGRVWGGAIALLGIALSIC